LAHIYSSAPWCQTPSVCFLPVLWETPPVTFEWSVNIQVTFFVILLSCTRCNCCTVTPSCTGRQHTVLLHTRRCDVCPGPIAWSWLNAVVKFAWLYACDVLTTC
jgi:hypothetical protein